MKAIYRKTASKLLAVFMACVIILSYSGIANAEEGMSWSFSKTFKVKMATVLNSDGGIVGVDVVGAEKAKEYEVYMLAKGEVANNMGLFTISGVLYSILGISTVPGDDQASVIDQGDGAKSIKTQMYTGDGALPEEGTEIFIGVEALDENYEVIEQSNLVAMNMPAEGEQTFVNVDEESPEDDVSTDEEDDKGNGAEPETVTDTTTEAVTNIETATEATTAGSDDSSKENMNETSIKKYIPIICVGSVAFILLILFGVIFIKKKSDDDEKK